MVRQFFSLSPYSTEQFFVSVQASSVYYWAAREGNAQSNNVGRLVCAGKRQNGGRNSQKALRKPFPFSGADFLGEGTALFRLSGEQIWKLIRTNTKLFRGVFGPMSTPNDYLNAVFDNVVSLCESCRNSALLRPHGKSFNLLQFSPGA